MRTETSHYLVSNAASAAVLGVWEGESGEDAIRAMLADAGSKDEPDADLTATEVPVDNDAYEWVQQNADEAEADDDTYPEGTAALWRHQNGRHFFAHPDEDHVGSGAKLLAHYNLVDREFVA